MKRCDSVSIKDLLLLLNLKAEKSNIQYVLQYNYSFHKNRHSLFTRSLILKFNDSKLISKNQLYSQNKIVDYLTQEMKLYA